MAEIDWAKLQAEYASTTISYRKLAEKHGVSFNTLKKYAVRDNWTTARKRYRDKRAKLVQQKLAGKSSTACAKQLARVAKSAETATVMIESMMADADQFRRHLIQVKRGEGVGKQWTEEQEVEERIYDKYDTKALKEFTGALKDLVTVIRNVNNLPTLQEQAAMDNAEKRLQLDKQKATLADDVDDDETGVVILPPVMEDEDASNGIGGGPQADQADADSVEPAT